MKPRITKASFAGGPSVNLPAFHVSTNLEDWAREFSKVTQTEGEFVLSPGFITMCFKLREYDRYENLDLGDKDPVRKRPISSPHHWIRTMQTEILTRIPRGITHPQSFAYEKGKSAIECARQHVGMRWGIKLDISDFFHQIRTSNVADLFRCLGASNLSAEAYAKILTRLPRPAAGYGNLGENGLLPQGSPASGAIANLVCYRLDTTLQQIADKYGMTYTRYSDDILLSSTEENFSKLAALRILKEIRVSLNRFELNVNKKKTRIYSPESSHQYLGVLIGADKLRLPAHFRKEIRDSLRLIKKFGLENIEKRYSEGDKFLRAHQGKSKMDSFRFLTRFVGKLSYAAQLEPSIARSAAHDVVQAILVDADAWLNYDPESRNSIRATLNKLTRD